MKKLMMTAVAATLTTAVVATPADAGEKTRRTVRGGVIGAAGGAVAGALIPGLSVGTGALIGGAGGAIIGNTTRSKHYDRNGRRYYIRHGRRVYY